MAEVNLGSVYGKLELDTTQWKASVDQAKQTMAGIGVVAGEVSSKTSKSLGDLGQQMERIGARMSIAITAPLTLFGKAAIGMATDLEVGWKEVQKVYGSTATAFVDDQQMLSEAVERLSIKFGSQKLATVEALGALAAMGYEGSDAIRMLEESMGFAITGQMDLNTAMTGAVAISKIYNVQGDELTKTLALLNAVENATGASMADLNEAISTAGSSALVAKVGVGDLSAMVAALRERAIPAGEAANALKTIFTRVYKVTDDAKDVYEKFGITIEEVEKKTGKIKTTTGGNADEVERLGKKLESTRTAYADYASGVAGVNMTEEQRKKKLEELTKQTEALTREIQKNKGEVKEINGTYVVSTGVFRSANDILKDVAKSWDKMSDAEKFNVIQSNAGIYQRDKFVALMMDMNSEQSTYLKTLGAIGDETQNLTTYEKEMAVFLDTSKVKLAQATVQFDNMKAAIGSLILESLVPLMGKLAEAAKWVTNLDTSTQRTIVNVGIFAAALGPLLVVLGQIFIAVGALKGALIGLWGVMLAHPLIALVTAVALLTAAVGTLIIQSDLLKTKHDLVTQAENNERIAKEGLKQATDALVKSDKQLEQAELRVEGATLNVEQATKNYDEISKRYGKTSLEARQAEHNLELARLELKDATEALDQYVIDAQKNLEEHNKVSAEAEEAARKLAEEQAKPKSAFERLAGAIGDVIGKIREYVGLNVPGLGISGIDLVHRQGGGYLGAGQAAIVGERGPEVFVPSSSGHVIPNKKLVSGGGFSDKTVNLSVNVGIYAGSEMEKRALAKELADALEDYQRATGEGVMASA